MERNTEQHIRHLTQKSSIPQPDFNAMWARIDENHQQTQHKDDKQGQSQVRSIRNKVVTVALAAASLSAVPVLANVQINFFDIMKSSGREGIVTSMKQGLGQNIEKSDRESGGTLTLHNALADMNRLVLNFSFKLKEKADFDAVTLVDKTVRDAVHYPVPGQTVVKWDEAKDRIIGFFETEKGLPDTVQMKLEAKDIRLLKTTQVPLELRLQDSNYWKAEVDNEAIAYVEILSVKAEGKSTRVKYRTLMNKQEDKDNEPELVFTQAGVPVAATHLIIYNPEEKYQKREVTLDISPDELKDTQVSLSYKRHVKTVKGSWSIPFDYDHELAVKDTLIYPLYSLNKDVEGGRVHLKQLIASPSQIKVVGSRNFTNADGYINYWKKELIVGEKRIPISSQDDANYYIELPEILDVKDHKVQLVFSDAFIAKKGEHTTMLDIQSASTSKQTTQIMLKDITVDLTYYAQGDVFVVETSSKDSRFGGVNQTYLIVNGKRVMPKSDMETLYKGKDNHVKEVYEGIPVNAKVELDVNYYNVLEPERVETHVLKP
ncbi:hypothetical protein SY83_18985 [Paenibacillus swuensis]|uniref:Uncharacterized protein n=1 Tax=Paenibacillus swuensis TaxID=1178515 RepID=A0A172TM20_9BACL|nr:DUF4179 domain-containing protein [Paenibacillus swuensis]ANE48032.1 hypothetical protein SY83_18985 [Paenibacillus swuensis]